MSERIGILTGGGDCPGLNAVIRAVVKAASYRGWETYGFNGGFEGLLEPMSYRKLEWKEMGALLYRGGTVLGTTNKGRFSAKTGHGESRGIDPEVLAAARRGFEALGLRALVCLGGDGTMSIAQQMQEAGVPVVGVPKTIDNDLDATIMTFGFETAVSCAVDALDRLHTTAESHNRVMVLEVMGRYAGWIAGMAGLAGGADLILIPEIPFTWEGVAKKVQEREADGKHFTIVIVAEGARVKDGGFVTAGEAGGEREARLGGIGDLVAKEIEKRTGKEARACVLGHLQRGGAPSPWDRQLCTRFGVAAVEMIAHEQYGCMAALQASGIVAVPLPEAIGKLKTVPPEGELVRTARAIGMSFGDA